MAMKVRPMLDYVKDGLDKVKKESVIGIDMISPVKGAKPSMVEATGHSLKGHWRNVQLSWGRWDSCHRC